MQSEGSCLYAMQKFSVKISQNIGTIHKKESLHTQIEDTITHNNAEILRYTRKVSQNLTI